jgi:hypothetical protein
MGFFGIHFLRAEPGSVGAADSSGEVDGVCGAATGVLDFGCHFLRSMAAGAGGGFGVDVGGGAGSGAAARGSIVGAGVEAVCCSGEVGVVLGCHFLRSGVAVGEVV